MPFRRIITAAVALALLLTPTFAIAQSSDLRNFMEIQLRDLNKGWVFDYEFNSVGEPAVLELSSDQRSAVLKASYRYTNGRSDTIYLTVRDGRRTCVGYAYFSERCTLTGKTMGVREGVGVAIVACLLFCGSGNRQSSSSAPRYNPDDDPEVRRKRALSECMRHAYTDSEYAYCHERHGF